MTLTSSPVPVYEISFTLMREFTEELDRLFGSTAGWHPPVEFVRRNGNVRITATLPNLPQDTVRMFVSDRTLVIEGERHGHCFRGEVPLPDGINPRDVIARSSESMLIVEFPFDGAAPSRR